MNYYVRNPGSSELVGPFNAEEIAAKLRAGELAANAMATNDTGDSPEHIALSPTREWLQIEQIPGLNAVQHDQSGEARPVPPPLPLESAATDTSDHGTLERPSSGVAYCPHCGRKVEGEVVPDETVCAGCGKLLLPRTIIRPVPDGKKSSSTGSAVATGLGCLGSFFDGVVVALIAIAIFGPLLISLLFSNCRA